jgi:hypothetical protein
MAEWRTIIARDECGLEGQPTVAGLRIGRASERTDDSLPLGNAHDLDDVKRVAATLGRRLAGTPK